MDVLVLPGFDASALTAPFRPRPADGGFPGEWLVSFGASARTTAMANAAVSLGGPESAYSNPAGLADGGLGQATFLAAPLLASAQYQALSFNHPVRLGSYMGMTFAHLGSGQAEKTDSFGRTGGSFKEEQYAALLGWGERLTSQMDGGLTLKLIRQSMAEYSASGFGLDLGWRFRGESGWLAGVSLVNAAPARLRLKEERERFPLVLRIGPGYAFSMGERFFLLATEFDWIKPDSRRSIKRWGVGFEALVLPGKTPLTLRLGINHREYTAGFGLANGPIEFDYAVAVHELDLFHRFGLTLRFGYLSPLAQKKIEAQWRRLETKEAELRLARTGGQEAPAADHNNGGARMENVLTQIRISMAQGEWDMARRMIDQASAADPQDSRLPALRRELEQKIGEEKIKIEKQNVQVYYGSGLYREALDAAMGVLRLAPKDQGTHVLALMSQARLYIAQGEYGLAQDQLRRAVELDPEFNEAAVLFRKVKTLVEVEGTGGRKK